MFILPDEAALRARAILAGDEEQPFEPRKLRASDGYRQY
jgi:hypothetical protein